MLRSGAGYWCRCWVLVLVLELVGTGAGAEVRGSAEVQRSNVQMCRCEEAQVGAEVERWLKNVTELKICRVAEELERCRGAEVQRWLKVAEVKRWCILGVVLVER